MYYLLTGNNNASPDEREQDSEKQSPIEKSSVCLKSLNILVHFEYSEQKFPLRIKANDFGQFYDKVVLALKSKVPDCKSHCMQYQCGSKWYDFNRDTGFDCLCLNEDNPEISIRLIPTISDPHLGNLSVSISVE